MGLACGQNDDVRISKLSKLSSTFMAVNDLDGGEHFSLGETER